jgi:ribulose 1,5-bisphosphate synthetase/thiazole synthase
LCGVPYSFKRNTMRLTISFLSFVLFVQIQLQAQQTKTVDICIYGGTSAGVIAAYTAKKAGKNVVLIEPGNHLGGLSSGGLGYTDIGNKFAVTGLARDFYRRIGKHYGKFEQWIFEPHVAEETFQFYIKKGNVDVLYDHRLVKVSTQQAQITEIIIENTSTPTPATNQTIRAKIFIDCSYEGDLMAVAHVSYVVGREANEQYNETYNGVQLLDKHQFPDGIDPYRIPGKPESGLLWGISPEVLQDQGSGDKKVQAYNFRICLTDDPNNRIAITQPEDYDSNRYELLIRLLQMDPNRRFNQILKPDLMPNRKTDINNNGPFSTDMIGMNYDYPEADYARRKQIMKEHENYNKGLLYFIGHSKRVPRHLREEMLRWGYPKDEYQDNGNWSPQMYVREARRMVGVYVMTQANCEGKEVVEDGVGMAAYTMDSHNTSRVVVNGMVKNEGDVQIGGFPPYPISYRSLIPKETECKNLLVPVCLSATHIAYGSIRMEPVFMVLGQSSALAAVQAINKKGSVQSIDVKALQRQLRNDPLADGSLPEILIDNEDTSAVSLVGSWSTIKNAHASYGPSYFKGEPKANENQSVNFKPAIQKTGPYQVYVYFPKVDQASTKVSIVLRSGKAERKVIVRPNEIKVEGQTSGEWVFLGKHQFVKNESSAVEVTTSDADGVVIADAVLLIPE